MTVPRVSADPKKRRKKQVFLSTGKASMDTHCCRTTGDHTKEGVHVNIKHVINIADLNKS